MRQYQQASYEAKSDRMLKEAAELNLQAQLRVMRDIQDENTKIHNENTQLNAVIGDKDEEIAALKKQIAVLNSEKRSLSDKLDKEKNQRKESDAKVRSLQADLKKTDTACRNLNKEVESERKLRLKAEKKAEGTVLSRYIIAKLNGSANDENNS